MEDLTWIVLFVAGGYWLAILIGGIKGAIEDRRQKERQDKQEPIETNDEEDEEKLSCEDSEGDGLFFNDPLFPPEFEDIED